jgi:hypothetical protein
MKPLNGTSRCRRLALLMALSSCALQVLGFSLPSLVVCYRADRPPQVELFADGCSCRQAACHSACQYDAPGAPCLEAACIDIHLGPPAMIAAAASRHHAPTASGRLDLVNERSMAMTGATAPQPARCRCGPPAASTPPLQLAMPAGSRLRC